MSLLWHNIKSSINVLMTSLIKCNVACNKLWEPKREVFCFFLITKYWLGIWTRPTREKKKSVLLTHIEIHKGCGGDILGIFYAFLKWIGKLISHLNCFLPKFDHWPKKKNACRSGPNKLTKIQQLAWSTVWENRQEKRSLFSKI